jgi:hypothetical protein
METQETQVESGTAERRLAVADRRAKRIAGYRQSPSEFRTWCLEQLDWLSDAETDAAGNPGFDPLTFSEDKQSTLDDAAEIASRLGLADLVAGCRVKGADLRVVLSRCIAACDELIGRPVTATPAALAAQPADPRTATKKQPGTRPPLKPHYTLAYEQCLRAERAGAKTYEQAWNWLLENEPDLDSLPQSKTWARYAREGRKHDGNQKNTPRAERTGRSIVDISGRRIAD